MNDVLRSQIGQHDLATAELPLAGVAVDWALPLLRPRTNAVTGGDKTWTTALVLFSEFDAAGDTAIEL